jgi:CheY-like chemotaxis protein
VGDAHRARVRDRDRLMGRVLVVDDHEDIRKMLARLVRSHGHESVAAADGTEAIALATESAFGLIILDLMMPGITGFDVLRNLRSDPRTKTVAIVIYSALGDSDFIEQALSLGANDYWVKGTFDIVGLGTWLNYYLAEGKQ